MLKKIKRMMSQKDTPLKDDLAQTAAPTEAADAPHQQQQDPNDNAETAMENPSENPEAQAEAPQDEALASAQTEIAALQAQVAELKDKYLRLMAEFDNFRKRTAKERVDLAKMAAKDTLSALLPVADDFDRAKRNADDDASTEQFSEGVLLVYNKFQSTLKQMGVEKFNPTGQAFDAEQHEAITEIPAPSEELKGKIIDTVEQGYKLHDKIIRYAKVVVGK